LAIFWELTVGVAVVGAAVGAAWERGGGERKKLNRET